MRTMIPIDSGPWMPNPWHRELRPNIDGERIRSRRGVTRDAHDAVARSSSHIRRTSSVSTAVQNQRRFKSFPIQDDEHFLTVCRYVEPNALRVEWVSRAEQWRCGSLWRSAQNAETNPALLTSWPISRPRGGITRVNPPLTEKGLRPFYERLPFILYNVAIIAQQDEAPS